MIAAPLIPYGGDWPDLDLWEDRDGRIYSGRGPYHYRPSRVIRRKVAHWILTVRRRWAMPR